MMRTAVLDKIREAETNKQLTDSFDAFKNDFDEEQKKRKKHIKTVRIISIILMILIAVMIIIKYIIYFTPENVKDESDAKLISEVQPDVGSLYIMPFNTDLTVANQEILFVGTKDRTAEYNLLSPESNNVLVRAEIYIEKDMLDKKPIKKFFHNIVYKNDGSLVRIGDTGWLHPGEILTNIKLDELPNRSCQVTIHYTAVNPLNENISAGSFDFNTMLYVVDFKGKMLDENGKWINAG